MATRHQRYLKRAKKPDVAMSAEHPDHDPETLRYLTEIREKVASARSDAHHVFAPSGRGAMERVLGQALAVVEAAIAEYHKNPTRYNPRD